MYPKRRPRNLKQITLLGMSFTPLEKHPPPLSSKTRRRIVDSDEDSSKGDPEVRDIRTGVISSPPLLEQPSSAVHIRKKRRILLTDSDKEHDDNEDISSNELSGLPTSSPVNSRRALESGSDSNSPSPRRLSRRKRLHRSPSPKTSEEDLADEVDVEKIIEPRLRERGKQSNFQRNLKKLIERKRGITVPVSEGDENLDPTDTTLFEGAKPISEQGNSTDDASDSSKDDSGFIVEDDENPTELPIEFSMRSHQDASVQFKTIFQFFVYLAIQRPEGRHAFMKLCLKEQPYFAGPILTMRRKLSGIRDSLVASSMWGLRFRKLLEEYPVLSLSTLEFSVHSCDACKIAGRTSTIVGRIGGAPYDPCGFEEEKESGSEEESDGDDEVRKKEFHLGRFCAKRVRVFHDFVHWEYTLFKLVLEEVIALRLQKTKGPGLDNPDLVCDWLDRRGVIDMEWRKVKDMMESARNLDVFKRGDDQEL